MQKCGEKLHTTILLRNITNFHEGLLLIVVIGKKDSFFQPTNPTKAATTQCSRYAFLSYQTMAQNLYSDEISSISEATDRFSSEKGLLLLRPHRPCCSSLHFTIPSGCYALVTRHGADEEYTRSDGSKSIVWPPGLHYPYPPWVHVSNLVTMQTIVMDLPVKACKTKDNVTVNIDVALAFRIMGDPDLGEDPNLVRIFVYELTPRGLEQQLRDAQDEEVRTLARSLKHTEIYGIRSGENSKHIRESLSGSGVGGSIARKNAEEVSAGEEGEGVREQQQEEEKMELQPILEEGEGDEEKDALHGENIMENEEVISASVIPTHRDETLVGSADIEDQKAAVRATAAGIDVTDYMKKKLNRQFM